MGMKIVAIAENDMVFENLQGEQIQEVIKKTTDKYGAEIKIIRDHGLECEGDDWRGAALKIEQQGPGWVRHDPETLAEVADADVIIVSFIGVGEQLLDAAKNLKLVAAMRSGVENVDVKACQERGVMVCNAPGRLKDPVSDFACALILDINRGITYMTKSYTPGVVQDIKPYFQPELFRDLTLGIVGLGYIGKEVARKLANFGFKFIAYDPFVTQEEADKYGVKMMSLEEVMSQADTITVHARLVPATKNMINADMIALMKPSAFFVNTARAGLEDEPALVKALQEKRIRGAALDVYWEEPLPDDHPLRKLDNVILTPHMAGVSGDSFKISMDIIMNQVGMFLGARSRHLPLGRSSSDSESAFSFAKGALMEAATSFSFLEALFIGFLYYWAYSEISLPGPWGAGIQDASTIGLLIGAFYGDWVQGLIIGSCVTKSGVGASPAGASLPAANPTPPSPSCRTPP
jgi:D-3-phosphoglycerate dehydrogenase